MNATDILGGLLQGALGGTSRGRLGHAMGDQGLGGAGGPLGQILGQLAGGGGSGGGAGSAGTRSGRDVIGDLSSLSRQLGRGSQGRAGRGTAAGGLAEAAATSGFGVPQGRTAAEPAPRASAEGGILGGNMRGAVGAGGLAMLAMLAMRALRGASTPAAASAPPAAAEPTDLPEETVSEDAAMLALRAMIDAAKADGQIDGTEMQRILGKLDEAGASAEEKDLVLDELRKPTDIEGLAAAARTPELAAQAYAAALLAIEVDTEAERSYLQRLTQALRLQPETTARLHAALGAPAAY